MFSVGNSIFYVIVGSLFEENIILKVRVVLCWMIMFLGEIVELLFNGVVRMNKGIFLEMVGDVLEFFDIESVGWFCMICLFFVVVLVKM